MAAECRGVDIRIRRYGSKGVIRFEVPYRGQFFRALTVREGEVLNRTKLLEKFEWVAAMANRQKAADDESTRLQELRRVTRQRANLMLERAGLAIRDFYVDIHDGHDGKKARVTLYLPTSTLERLGDAIGPLFKKIHETERLSEES